MVDKERQAPAAWQAPSEDGSWVQDRMHFPRPVPHLAHGVLEDLARTGLGCEAAVINGYGFLKDYSPPPPPLEVTQRGAEAVWREDYQPHIAAVCAGVRSRDYASMTAPQLAAELPGIVRETAGAFRYTMLIVGQMVGSSMALLDFCKREVNGDPVSTMVRLLQGFQNETADSGAGLADLAEHAAGSPGVARCLTEGRYYQIEAEPGGREFMSRLRAYLADYGWRAEGMGDLDAPTWYEDPGKPLSLIARYVAQPEHSPSSAIERSVRQRDAAIAEVEAGLTGEGPTRFRSLLEAARHHVPLSESRAHWQLTLAGSLRVPVLALGEKLVAQGTLDRPSDVFYLRLEELPRTADGSEGPLRDLVARRQAEREAWEKLTPPPFVGAPPDMSKAPPEMVEVMQLFFGPGEPMVRDNVVQGQAASRGTARGTARVISGLADAGRLQTGEVLVCASTSPPWTPLFAVAGAVVTDTGGPLSHSAICAREYAIPCVVATQVATSTIPDGATVLVDGSAGTVTIETRA